MDLLRWFADVGMAKRWHSSDAVCQQLQELIQIWYAAGTYDQLYLGGVAAMEEPARQIQGCVDAHSDPDHMSWADSRYYTGFRRAGALVPSLRRHVAPQIKDFKETELAQRRFRGISGGLLVVQAATVLPSEPKSRLWRLVLDVVTLTKAAVEALGKGRRQVAEAFLHWQNDVSLGRNAGFWRSWCCAAVRVCQTFSVPS